MFYLLENGPRLLCSFCWRKARLCCVLSVGEWPAAFVVFFLLEKGPPLLCSICWRKARLCCVLSVREWPAFVVFFLLENGPPLLCSFCWRMARLCCVLSVGERLPLLCSMMENGPPLLCSVWWRMARLCWIKHVLRKLSSACNVVCYTTTFLRWKSVLEDFIYRYRQSRQATNTSAEHQFSAQTAVQGRQPRPHCWSSHKMGYFPCLNARPPQLVPHLMI